VSILVLAQTLHASIRTLHQRDANATQTVQISGALCGTVLVLRDRSVTAQPSHSDDPSNASEFVGLDTANLLNIHDVLAMTL
jgi:hypothetical protein